MNSKLLFIAALLSLCCSGNEAQRIRLRDYVDKMKAGWIGQMAGVGWGAPTEFRWQGEIIPADQVPLWSPEMVNQFNQDDIYVEMTFLRTLELYGFDVDRRQAGIDFANSRYMLWHANKAGRDNLRAGIAPPFSGHPQFNPHADDIDYQIEADYSGLIAPGLQQAAIDLGEIFGRLMNYGDGLYGGQFVAGMYTAAFFETDIEKIVRTGLQCIPRSSLYYQTISDVLNWYKEYPNDWQQTWKLIQAKYQNNPEYRRFSCTGPTDKFNIDAKINGAYIVMGLLYGKGDPDSTIIISMRCGQDSDCNPSNAAGILFTTLGFSRLPNRFTSALDTVPKFSYTDYNFSTLVRVCETLARQAVLRYGGKIERDADGEEWFLIPQKPLRLSQLEQCWSPLPVTENVQFTPEERAKIHFTERRSDEFIRTWQVSGPYMKTGVEGSDLFDVVFAPETGSGAWKTLAEGSFNPAEIDLTKLFGTTNCAAYLRTVVIAPEDREAVLELGSDDGIKVWLNGQVVHAANVQRGHTAGEDKVPVRLNKGQNRLLIKVTQGVGGWAVSAVITDKQGKAMTDLGFQL